MAQKGQSVKKLLDTVVKSLKGMENDSVKFYASFKDTQISRFQTGIDVLNGKDVEIPSFKSSKQGDSETATPAKANLMTKAKSAVLGIPLSEAVKVKDEEFQQFLKSQAAVVATLKSNVYNNKYAAPERLRSPKGNPNYYKAIVRELRPEAKKLPWWKAAYVVLTGKV